MFKDIRKCGKGFIKSILIWILVWLEIAKIEQNEEVRMRDMTMIQYRDFEKVITPQSDWKVTYSLREDVWVFIFRVVYKGKILCHRKVEGNPQYLLQGRAKLIAFEFPGVGYKKSINGRGIETLHVMKDNWKPRDKSPWEYREYNVSKVVITETIVFASLDRLKVNTQSLHERLNEILSNTTTDEICVLMK